MSNDHLHPNVVVQPTGVVNAGPGKTADALCAAQQHLHDDHDDEEDNSNDDVLYWCWNSQRPLQPQEALPGVWPDVPEVPLDSQILHNAHDDYHSLLTYLFACYINLTM